MDGAIPSRGHGLLQFNMGSLVHINHRHLLRIEIGAEGERQIVAKPGEPTTERKDKEKQAEQSRKASHNRPGKPGAMDAVGRVGRVHII